MTPTPVPILVLLVDDEHLILDLLKDALEEGGYAVVTANGSKQAIEMLDQTADDYRAIVTDINMGGGQPDGWAVARRARERNPGIPIVYMTGDSAGDWTANGVPNSVLIAKPFAPAQVVTAVSQLINAAGPVELS